MIYFTSDLHVGHKNIVKFTDRSLVTTQEQHDEWLRNLWNSQVSKGDFVYILGDISFANLDYTKDFLSSLNGQKFVIKGNHDNEKHLDYLRQSNTIVGWEHYKEIKVLGKDGTKYSTCLFHFAIASWHKQNYGSWHLHGHSHGSYQGDGLCLDVGIDSAYNILGEHRLFTAEDIENFMQNRQIVIKDIHRKDCTNYD